MRQELFQNARFLIVDDEMANVMILEQFLEQWDCHNVSGTTDPRETVPLFIREHPDIILLDLMMPEMDGFQVMEQLQPLIPESDYVPILVLTADPSNLAKRKALAQGGKDFLTKPFDREELQLRLWNLLETRYLHRQLRSQNDLLEEKVRERTQQVQRAEVETLECLAAAGEYRDDDTGQHTQRVGEIAARIACSLGMADAEAEAIGRAAPLHDVGKIGISDLILLKPGKLEPEEVASMKQHTLIGAGILSRYHTPLLELAQSIAITHHERWNGSGYPHGLQGEDIPVEGRIVAVADVFDALTHDRPYKAAWTVADALAEINVQSGAQFDKCVVQAFLTLSHETLI